MLELPHAETPYRESLGVVVQTRRQRRVALVTLVRTVVSVTKRANIDHGSGRLRPVWRGRLHAIGAAVSPVGGIGLATAARGGLAVAASLVFAASMTLVYAVSAWYHIVARTELSQAVMRRLDHAAIYLLIAGSHTPVCLLGLPREVGVPLLFVVWAGAFFGVVLQVLKKCQRFAKALYMLLGWSMVVTLPLLFDAFGHVVWLILAGGVVYSVGALMFSKRWPGPRATTFGYHEVWHAATLVAGALHFGAVTLLLQV